MVQRRPAMQAGPVEVVVFRHVIGSIGAAACGVSLPVARPRPHGGLNLKRSLPRVTAALFVLLAVVVVAGRFRPDPSLPAQASVTTPATTPAPMPIVRLHTRTPRPRGTPTAAAQPPGRSVVAASPPSHPIPIITPAPMQVGQLDEAVDALVAETPAHLGVEVALPDGTILYQHNADTQYEAASLYKLGIMVELYRQREAGSLSFDDLVTLEPGFFYEDDPVYGDADVGSQISIGDLLTEMITVSSNVAAEALLYTVGTDQVNATMASLGLSSTQIRWSPVARLGETPLAAQTLLPASGDDNAPTRADVSDAWNVTSPRDMERLFQLLLAGKVVSAKASQEMLDLLSRQTINDRLPAGLPDSVRVAHKTGNLDDDIHDVGVIYGPKGPIIVIAMSDEIDNQDDVVAFMQRLGQIAYAVVE